MSKLNVLVIGIRGNYLHELRRKYKKRVKITGITDQDSNSIFRDGSYDLIISVLKFTNHNTERMYGSSSPNFVRIGEGKGQTHIPYYIDLALGANHEHSSDSETQSSTSNDS